MIIKLNISNKTKIMNNKPGPGRVHFLTLLERRKDLRPSEKGAVKRGIYRNRVQN